MTTSKPDINILSMLTHCSITVGNPGKVISKVYLPCHFSTTYAFRLPISFSYCRTRWTYSNYVLSHSTKTLFAMNLKKYVPLTKSLSNGRLIHNLISTSDNLDIRCRPLVSRCSLCQNHIEYANHLSLQSNGRNNLHQIGQGMHKKTFLTF